MEEIYLSLPTIVEEDDFGPVPITIVVGRPGSDILFHACPDCGEITIDVDGPTTLALDPQDFDLIGELLMRTSLRA